jgi:hypothetical protein
MARGVKENLMRRSFFITVLALAAASYGMAQQAQQSQGPAPTLAQIGMYVYPAKGQTPDQQKADEDACTQWAEAQTGLTLEAGKVDTQAAAQAAQQQTAEATQGAAVAGAAKGAVVGVAIGAIAGNAGEGAAIGAVAGGLAGRRAKKRAEAGAAQQGAEQAQAQANQNLATFKQAAGACLSGRGYTVN